MRQAGWRRIIKQTMDRTIALGVLVVASPILAATAAVVRVTLGTPVLFRQTRPGHNGTPFQVIKFRTMRDALDATGKPLPDHERLTTVGKVLRATSLDELPQLVNVLRGDLSLVGPRPLLMQYLDRYSDEQARRHDVLPGITGWAQINGRNALSWPTKLSLDVWYVDHWSLVLDFYILLKTVVRVVGREGVARDGHVTTPEFMGET